MIDVCTLEGKHISCISGDSLDTSYTLCEQFHGHLWILYDALSIHGWTWDHHLCIWSRSDVSFNDNLHMGSHILEKYLILEEVAKFNPLGPGNKYVDPTMDWVYKFISNMEMNGGNKVACFHRKLIDTSLTFLCYEQQQSFPWSSYDALGMPSGTWKFQLIKLDGAYGIDAQEEFLFMLEDS